MSDANVSGTTAPGGSVDEITDPVSVWILSFLLLINALGSVFGNAVVIYTFIAEKPLAAPLRIILSNLALVNLLIAAIGEPMVVISGFKLGWAFGDMGRSFEAYIVTAGGLISMATLAFVSVERYLRLNSTRSAKITEPVAAKVILFIWIFNFTYASLPFHGIASWTAEGVGISNSISWDTEKLADLIYVMVMMAIGYFLPLIVICFCYQRILFFVKKAVELVEAEGGRGAGSAQPISQNTLLTVTQNSTNNQTSNQSVSDNNSTSAAAPSTRGTETGASEQMMSGENMTLSAQSKKITVSGSSAEGRVKGAEKQISNVIFVIIISFFVSWTPYTIINLLMTFDQAHYFKTGIRATAPAFLAKTSTLWSPIIYFAMNGEVRTANHKTIKALKRQVRILYFGGPGRVSTQ